MLSIIFILSDPELAKFDYVYFRSILAVDQCSVYQKTDISYICHHGTVSTSQSNLDFTSKLAL